MRTINFTEQDIKDCKLALANQNLTSFQSAFLGQYINNLEGQLQQKENIIKEVIEDLYQVVKWCTENKHNEDTIERYLVIDYGTTVGKINEIRTKLDKVEENK